MPKKKKKMNTQRTVAPVEPQPVELPTGPIQVDEAEGVAINQAVAALRAVDSKLAALRLQYRRQEDDLISQRGSVENELNATVKMAAKRHDVPEGWLINIDVGQFEPPRE